MIVVKYNKSEKKKIHLVLYGVHVACVCKCVCASRTWLGFSSGASWLTGSCITISNTIMYTLHSGTLLWVCARLSVCVSVSVCAHFNSIPLKHACHCSTQSISLAVINCHNQISFLKNTCGSNQTNKDGKNENESCKKKCAKIQGAAAVCFNQLGIELEN